MADMIPMRPTIGITVDNQLTDLPSQRYLVSASYAQAVEAAGGVPVLLAQLPERIDDYLVLCDGLILTGGDDPHMEPFGQATDPRATPVSMDRQVFETALLAALARQPDKPTLGVCLGMQMMGLIAGGQLEQYLPASMGEAAAAAHWNDRRHALQPTVPVASSPLFTGHEPDTTEPLESVVSHHRQAITNAGRLRVVATAEDGVIEAIDDPSRRFYVGVQWHPERGGPGPLHLGVIRRLVAAARGD